MSEVPYRSFIFPSFHPSGKEILVEYEGLFTFWRANEFYYSSKLFKGFIFVLF